MSTLVFALLCFILRVAAEASAVLELTGDIPKMIWGERDAIICELTLDRVNTRLTSTCPLFTAENDELKAKVVTLDADNTEMKMELAELKTENA